MYQKPKHKRSRPKQKERNAISKVEYKNTLDYFGDTCTICNMYPVEMHHVTFRSQGGRGVYRNLMPLCRAHHRHAHDDRHFAEFLREMRQESYGKHYYKDMYDLYDEGLISDTTQQKYEEFMKSEELK